jgi:aspartate/methionine/tyrosine aminotransferase
MASNAGVFLWVDLRKYLLADGDADMHHLRRSANAADSARYEEREAFIDATCMKHGVSIARGSLFFTEEWGWFRLTFTLPLEELREGIERMCKALSEVQLHSWGVTGVDKLSL